MEILIVPERVAGPLPMISSRLASLLVDEWVLLPDREERGNSVDHFLPGIRLTKKNKRSLKNALLFLAAALAQSIIAGVVEVFTKDEPNQKIIHLEKTGDTFNVQIFNVDGKVIFMADSISKDQLKKLKIIE